MDLIGRVSIFNGRRGNSQHGLSQLEKVGLGPFGAWGQARVRGKGKGEYAAARPQRRASNTCLPNQASHTSTSSDARRAQTRLSSKVFICAFTDKAVADFVTSGTGRVWPTQLRVVCPLGGCSAGN
ncbi:hypothetical protein VOLCADRAFT_100104 [Volvox carteri f. nagariensis]|uniref:Uncharacterized protein n=1 Tax=Volvox carteri f. nagariensis TaxID=3068 RepID=D8UJF6_VOLCA|nr:uncharacterized protein VOLCADRAFT_100104 [Volvox carteri f. nagariensis]EFJ40143.1 hypothetical protein VOLCADRAFT_100104 [Volvox carteri f. nagariensis]|eukprot:XP_002958800.1 hypothetical protein VOLCADRAFT_100104 [Volvox carteri f. nagariensis]